MKSPQWIRLNGKGVFSIRDLTFEAPFSLYRNPYLIKFVVTDVSENVKWSVHKLLQSNVFEASFTGTLKDGRPVYTTKLWLIDNIEFFPPDGISFGKTRETPLPQSKYPLIGYFDKELAFDYEGWRIDTAVCKNPEEARAIYRNWRIPIDGTVLKLRHENATLDQHRNFAQIIMILLSIAKGTGITCNRYFFTWDDEEVEIWQDLTGDEIGPGAIVPEDQVTTFLKQALPAWQKLSKEQRDVLRLAKDYINLSDQGYMDTKLFQIAQAWEFLSKAWGIKGVLSDADESLRDTLLEAKTKWHIDNELIDVDGYWGSRISMIFEWLKLRDQIEKLAVKFGLDLKQIGFNLDLLKKVRDSVAHFGKLPIPRPTKSDRRLSDLLKSGQFSLQLLILRMLEYQGLVRHSTGGFYTSLDINKALKIARTREIHKKS